MRLETDTQGGVEGEGGGGISEMESLFFEKINKIDKPRARLKRKKTKLPISEIKGFNYRSSRYKSIRNMNTSIYINLKIYLNRTNSLNCINYLISPI